MNDDQDSDGIQPIIWRDDRLVLLDQRVLPGNTRYLEFTDAESAARAIQDMVVRGAPAIGITAAYAVVLAARQRYRDDPATWQQAIETDLRMLADARPTAVNLHWALETMRRRIAGIRGDPGKPLLIEAQRLHDEDIQANRRMGTLGSALIEPGSAVLTHCNTGSLATGGYGTALGVIRSAYAAGKLTQVYAGETRPWLQGARLTAWELVQGQIPVTLMVDSAAGLLMREGRIQWVLVGADRIAANGDVANKIGTYGLAVQARQHGVGFMVVAPTSTIDPDMPSGDGIPLEYRPAAELYAFSGKPLAPADAAVWNPVFDVTPAHLVDVLVTEKGVIHRPDAAAISALWAP